MCRVILVSMLFVVNISLSVMSSPCEAGFTTMTSVERAQQDRVLQLWHLIKEVQPLIGKSRSDLIRTLGAPSKIDMGGDRYLYATKCIKVVMDGMDEVCYISIDLQNVRRITTCEEIERFIGKPYEKVISGQEVNYRYALQKAERTYPVLFTFIEDHLVNISLFPSDC